MLEAMCNEIQVNIFDKSIQFFIYSVTALTVIGLCLQYMSFATC
jgi:hypothetical protein